MTLRELIDPAAGMDRKTYRQLTIVASVALLLVLTRESWLPDDFWFRAAAAAVFMIGYFLFWSITVRRLRECGQSTMFGWCFLFGGAVIPIYIGCRFDDLDRAEAI